MKLGIIFFAMFLFSSNIFCTEKTPVASDTWYVVWSTRPERNLSITTTEYNSGIAWNSITSPNTTAMVEKFATKEEMLIFLNRFDPNFGNLNGTLVAVFVGKQISVMPEIEEVKTTRQVEDINKKFKGYKIDR